MSSRSMLRSPRTPAWLRERSRRRAPSTTPSGRRAVPVLRGRMCSFFFTCAEKQIGYRIRKTLLRDAELRAFLAQSLDAHFPRPGLLVSQDHRDRRPARVGFFHLRFEAASSAVLGHAETGLAQGLGNAKRGAGRRLSL